MKTMTITLALLLAASSNLVRAADAGGFGENGPQSYIWAEVQMKRLTMAKGAMDKDKDGMISKDEYMAFTQMNAGKDYAMMDMDNDGMVSEAEWMSTLHPTSAFYGGFR